MKLCAFAPIAAARTQTPPGILTLPQLDWETGSLVDRGCLLDPSACTAQCRARATAGTTHRPESFFNSLKNERVHGVRYATRREAVSDLFHSIAVFYNRSRRHSSLGYLSPTAFLHNWIERQGQQDMAA